MNALLTYLAGVVALAKTLRYHPSLRSLQLQHTNLGDKGVKALCTSLIARANLSTNHAFPELDLSFNRIGDKVGLCRYQCCCLLVSRTGSDRHRRTHPRELVA